MWSHISTSPFFVFWRPLLVRPHVVAWIETETKMPVRLPQNPQAWSQVDGKNWGYTYPPGLPDLTPGSAASKKIVDYVMDRARESADVMKTRHPSWRKMDHTQTAFIQTDSAEALAHARAPRKPVSIVVPNSYAILETLLTYQVSALLAETIWQYDGVGPEDRYAAIMAEKLMEHQAVRFKHALNLYFQMRDMMLYGLGVVATKWRKHVVRNIEDVPITLLGIPLGLTRQIEVARTLYEGTELRNIDPYRLLLDPNRPCHELQDAEFVAWIMRDNIQNVLSEERDGYGFNARACQAMKPCTSHLYGETDSGRNTRSGFNSDSVATMSPVDRLIMVAKVLPSELGIGTGKYPEKWLLEIAGDHIVRNVERLNFSHGMFPASMLAADTDGYSVSPISRMETVYPCQHVLDFLINSHIKGIKQSQKIRALADPLRINLSTLLEDSDVVLLEEGAWGQGVGGALEQIKYTDVTAGNVRDAQFIMQIMERVSGATDSVQGIVRDKSESPSATEVDTAARQAISRLQKQARIGAIMNMYDLSMQVVHNLQQFMSASQYVTVSGRWESVLRNEFQIADPHILVDPTVFEPARDIIPRNGAIPGGTNVQGLMQWFQIVASNPITMQRTDIGRLALHLGRELGVHNAEDFYLSGPIAQTQVLPDAEVEAQRQAGNVVTVDEAIGAGRVF